MVRGAWLLVSHIVLFDAVCDPGEEVRLVSIAPAPVACCRLQNIGLSIVSFGANYRIQLLSLHLTTFPPPRANLLPDSDTGG